jgi:hypothetical protein
MGVGFCAMQGQASGVKEFHLSAKVFDNASGFFRQQTAVRPFSQGTVEEENARFVVKTHGELRKTTKN